jgi:signal transduction histidine kinase
MMETKARILVIDDEAGIRKGCRRALESEGYQLDEAGSYQEGLARVKEGEYDLALLDVMLPDGRGIDLLQDFQEIDPDMVCVIITGYATVELAIQAIKMGAYDFISKPFTADLLQMTVAQGIERRLLAAETRRLQSIEKQAAELKRTKEEMERLNEFKSEFIWTVAHELRSPVGGAQSLLRTLMRGLAGELSDNQRHILGRVESRLDELLELINDLLTLATAQTIGQDEPLVAVPLQAVLQKVLERISPLANNKQVDLAYEAPPYDLSVWGTQDGLNKVFSNLIGNAVKYTPSDGSVLVLVANNAVESEKIEITITDTGIGIPAEDLPHIWDDFYRASNAKTAEIQGTGLGLSIVKDLVERFAGNIEVQSQAGQGATFTIRLNNAATTRPPNHIGTSTKPSTTP